MESVGQFKDTTGNFNSYLIESEKNHLSECELMGAVYEATSH